MQQDLLGWRPRGGARPGAGRKRSSQRMPHVSRDPSRNSVFHITARVRRGLPSLRSTRVVRRIETTFRRGCERPDFRLVHYSLQRDHLHLIVEAADSGSLGRGVRGLLIRVARAANRVWGRRGGVIGDRYHHRRLPSPREVRGAITYVLNNARKHLGSLAPREIDPASSGRWFWGRGVDVPAVALPRYWLLRAGWSKAGTITIA
jgi:REP element-mobilizing transposase RayT